MKKKQNTAKLILYGIGALVIAGIIFKILLWLLGLAINLMLILFVIVIAIPIYFYLKKKF
jgi:hypothetical protein